MKNGEISKERSEREWGVTFRRRNNYRESGIFRYLLREVPPLPSSAWKRKKFGKRAAITMLA